MLLLLLFNYYNINAMITVKVCYCSQVTSRSVLL